MSELILPVYKPFIAGYQHHANCFSMLDLEHEMLYRKWFMNHFIQLMCAIDYAQNRQGLLDFYREDFYEAYSEIMVVQNVHQNIIKNYNKGIMGFIFDCIDDEQYIELIVNEFYIPGTKAYQKFDHDHGIFIYGYNKLEQIVHARYYKNELLSDTTLTFEEIENAYGHVVMTYHWCAHSKLFKKKSVDSVDMNVDVTRIRHSIEDLMKSRVRYRSNEYRVYGMRIYQFIKEHAQQLDENMAFDIRSLQIVCEHKFAMVKRLEIATQLGWNTSALLPTITDLAGKFNMLRYKFLKCILQQNRQSIPMLLSQLDQLEQEEYLFYEQLLQYDLLESGALT